MLQHSDSLNVQKVNFQRLKQLDNIRSWCSYTPIPTYCPESKLSSKAALGVYRFSGEKSSRVRHWCCRSRFARAVRRTLVRRSANGLRTIGRGAMTDHTQSSDGDSLL